MGEYYALILFAVVGMDIMAASRDLIAFYVGLELMAVSSYLLAGFLRYQARSNEAAMKYFITGTFASAITLYGVSLVYGFTGTTNYEQAGAALAAGGSTTGVALGHSSRARGPGLQGLGGPVPHVDAGCLHRRAHSGGGLLLGGPQGGRFLGHTHGVPHRLRGLEPHLERALHRARRFHHVRGERFRLGAEERQADVGLLLHRSRRLPTGRPGRSGPLRRRLSGRANPSCSTWPRTPS